MFNDIPTPMVRMEGCFSGITIVIKRGYIKDETWLVASHVYPLKARQNGRQFADDILKFVFLRCNYFVRVMISTGTKKNRVQVETWVSNYISQKHMPCSYISTS